MIDPQVYIAEPARVDIHPTARIDRWVKLSGKVTIGACVHCASMSHIGAGSGEVVFGNFSGCSSHVVICSGMPDLRWLRISAADPAHMQHPIRSKTVIGEYVVLFAGAIVLPGVTIGDGAIVGAGAVVRDDVAPWAVVAGVPARQVGERKLWDSELDLWMRGEMVAT